MIGISPFRVRTIRAFGVFYGIFTMVSSIGSWREIAEFSKLCESKLAPWRFVVRHFISNGMASAWTIAGWEVEGCFSRGIKFENPELLDDAARQGRGVMVVGGALRAAAATHGPI